MNAVSLRNIFLDISLLGLIPFDIIPNNSLEYSDQKSSSNNWCPQGQLNCNSKATKILMKDYSLEISVPSARCILMNPIVPKLLALNKVI